MCVANNGVCVYNVEAAGCRGVLRKVGNKWRIDYIYSELLLVLQA